jgi:hypothetical protein
VHLTPEPMRVKTLAELDALIGAHVTHERPEIYWEDSHGYFQFHSEVEARQALKDPYYQRFLPEVDWNRTVIREVRVYRNYSSDPTANWIVADLAIDQFGPMLLWRDTGRWRVNFGTSANAEARNPMVAVCLDALAASGVRAEADQDSLDLEINEGKAQPIKARR